MLLSQGKKLSWALILSLMLGMTGIAQANDDTEDPYETYNRSAYRFNNTVDQILLKPVATAYDKTLPAPVKKGVANFFSNLGEVPILVNDVLQANINYAMASTWRLLLNSTVGVLGLFDVASYIGIPKHKTDFGITLRKWGVKPRPYLVLPLFGPSSLVDAVAMPVDWQFSIYHYLGDGVYSALGTEKVSKRAEYLKYGNSTEITLDPYIFQRNAYLQQRRELLKQAQAKTEVAAAAELSAGYEFDEVME